MDRTRELWTAMGRTDAPPELDPRAVRARVNSALDAAPEERKIYMRQKVRFVLAAAALAAVVTGSALAVGGNLDVLQAFFKGDTSPAQAYVDSEPRSVSDGNYIFTVNSSVSDQGNAYLTVTVQAKNEETRKFLMSDEFIGMDTFGLRATSETTSAEQGAGPSAFSFSTGELKDALTENSRSFDLSTDSLSDGDTALRVRMGYMEKDLALEIPLSPAKSVTVTVGATGEGMLTLWNDRGGQVTVTQVVLTPLTCEVRTNGSATRLQNNVAPQLLFRSSDGSILTQNQLMTETSGGLDTYSYQFLQVMDLSKLKSVIFADREYFLDGSPSKAVEHDAALDPFRLPNLGRMDDGFALSVRALTEALGGVCTWDPVSGDATCVYRDIPIVLTPGGTAALVNGQSTPLINAVEVRDGSLVVDCDVFMKAWNVDFLLLRSEQDGKTVYGDWYVTP